MIPEQSESRASDPPVTEKLGESWYVLFLVVLGYAIYNLDKNVISVLIEPIKAEFSLSDTQISTLTGLALTIPFALACIPFGLLADRVSRKRLLVTIILCWSAMTGVAGFAMTTMVLFISRSGVGIFEAGFTPLSLSILSDSFPRTKRATAMGFYNLGSPLGIFLGMALGGWIASVYGWRAAFFVAGIPGVILAILIGLTIREPVRGRYDPPVLKEDKLPAMAVLTNIWRDRVIFHLMLGMVFCSVMPAVIAIWTPSFLIRIHGFNLRDAGLSGAFVIGLGGATGAALGGLLADRLGQRVEARKLLVPLFGVLMSIIFLVTAVLWIQSNALVLVMLGLASFFVQFLLGPSYGVLSGRCPPSLRAATFSVLLVTFNVVTYGLGSMALGLVSDALVGYAGTRSIAFAIASSAVFGLLGAFHLARAMRLMRVKTMGAALPNS